MDLPGWPSAYVGFHKAMMGQKFISVNCLVTFCQHEVENILAEGGYCAYYTQCQKTGYRQQKYHTKCGAFGWKRCTRYRQERYTYTASCKHSRCCSGYVGSSCSQAVCHGSTSCPNGGTCIRPDYCSCRTGYASPRCTDINECASNNGGCNHNCANTNGSFKCSCKSGYSLQNNRKTCVDINECSSQNGGCNQKCHNTAGSYECQCNNGYILDTDKRTCKDVNECLVNNAGCSDICTNTPGSFICSCNKGFSLQTDNKTCSDTNECLKNNGGCEQLCVNEHSSFHCQCKAGYKLSSDGVSCKDINECQVGSRCAHICNNTIGSYKCSCRPGYKLAIDNISCEDIDDCIGVNCRNGGTCIDHPRSYTCKCASGFEGNHCEKDIDECQFINGGCQDICLNSFGSFSCQCSNGDVLASDGFSCLGNTTMRNTTEVTVFEKRKIARHRLPRGCFYIKVSSCDGSGSPTQILLSSTSEWYRLTRNTSIHYTYGIVFAEVNYFSLPVSVSGIEIMSTGNGFKVVIGSLNYNENDGIVLTSRHSDHCWAFKLTPRDIHDFITSGSFIATYFEKLYDRLPDWVRLSKSGTGLLDVTDLKSDMVYGRNMNSLQECKGAPIHSDHLYNVFRFGTDFFVNIYGDQIRIPAPIRGNKFCIIVDICQGNAGTVYFVLPPESRNLLDNFEFFQSFASSYGLKLRPHGIGLSLNKGINVHYRTRSIRLWNGDDFQQYSVFPNASVWLNTGVEMLYKPYDWLNVDVAGQSEMFLSVPDLSKLLTGVFVDKWDGLMTFTKFTGTPSLKFKMLKKDVVLSFPDLAVASLQAYFSVGGSQERKWCGVDANPEGIFVSFLVGFNPFQTVPILKEWVFDLNVRIHAFLATNPSSKPTINITKDIVDLQSVVYKFSGILENFLINAGGEINNSTRELLQNLKNITNTFQEKLREMRDNPLLLKNILKLVSETWKLYVREYKKTENEIKDSFEFNADILSSNVSDLIDTTKAQIGRNINQIITKMRNQVFSAVQKYTGFGLRFTASLIKLSFLEFSLFDVEFIYSVEQLGQCNKFRKVYEIFNDEKSVKVLARATVRQQLGYFLSIESSTYLSVAFSISSLKFVAHAHAHVTVLGIRVSTDLLISNKGLQFVIEANIWNVFLARVEFLAELGHKWYNLKFVAKGQLLARSSDSKSDFQGSYLDGLRNIARETSDKAQQRLTAVQDKLSSAQKSLDHAKNKLTSAQEKVRKANSAFDSAIKSLEKAKEKLERAKAPFERALEKLKNAQRNVDRLCRIRSCHKVCVPGVKLRTCKKGWVRYPCLKRSGCLFRVPNLLCEAANLACRGVRAIAFTALEAAKLFVRAPMLAFDAAKALVSAAQFVVDKARVVLDVAVGILEVAKLGLDATKGVLEAAKTAVEGVKFLVGAALHVFELIVKYGLQNLLDVKNCRFEIMFSTKDLAEFEVSCDVQAFRTGWHTFKFEFDFKHPLNSMWRMAKSTVKSLLDIVKSLLKIRKKRDVAFQQMYRIEDGSVHNINERSPINETDININDTIQLQNIESNRISFFAENCKLFDKIYRFLSDSVLEIISITNESVAAFAEVGKVKEMLSQMKSNFTVENMTAESLGISPEYAFQDYNITDEELQNAIQNMNISGDPVIQEIESSTSFAEDIITDQLASFENVSLITDWLNVVENLTKDYFSATECSGFEDCVTYSFDLLLDLFHDDTMENSTENRNMTIHLQTKFQNLLNDKNRSVIETYNLSLSILYALNRLNESNVFCSEKPKIISTFTNQTIKAGSSVRLVCEGEGNPKPVIWWYHNDTLLAGKTRSELVIDKAEQTDAGWYKCVAGNLVSNTSSSDAFVKVEAQKQTVVCDGLWGYFPNPNDCNGFLQCVWGFPVPMPCPGGTVWSQKVLTCIHGSC